jgi:hypothetical protein
LTELTVQVQLLEAGVLTVNEVRAMRGLGPLAADGTAQLSALSSQLTADS